MSDLATLHLPAAVHSTATDLRLARDLLRAWRTDGVCRIAADPASARAASDAMAAGRRFFALPAAVKNRYVSDLTYSGYVAGAAESFTVCRDIPLDDPRVEANWPCHGPVPWPDEEYRRSMTAFMGRLASIGQRILRLTALGLGLEHVDALTRLAASGWHHLRALRFPARSGAADRGAGAHTDYGLLVIAAQDDVAGLYVRPPVAGEPRNRNWLESESSAGMYEDLPPWHLVEPGPEVLTVFPGDLLQFLTGGSLLATPHQVRLAGRERHSIAYFHEPSFQATLARDAERLHYGTHFTSISMRRHPDRVTTERILAENRLRVLEFLRS